MVSVNALRYGTKLHDQLLSALIARRDASVNKMQEYHAKWEQAEDTFAGYVKPPENEKKQREARKAGTQTFTTIQVPYSYSIMMAMLTYMAGVFLSRSPIFQFQGQNGEAQNSELSIETLIDYQMRVGRNLPPLYIWLNDVAKYSFGVMGVYWQEDIRSVTKTVVERPMVAGIPIPFSTPAEKQVTTTSTVYAGAKLFNIKPQDFRPDPRVPIWRLQDGEFAGRAFELSWSEALRQKFAGKYMNIDKLSTFRRTLRQASGGREYARASARVNLPGMESVVDFEDTEDLGNLNMEEMCVTIVPKVWKLGSSEVPEKWMFQWAEDEVLVFAEPLGLDHDRYPYVVQEADIDGYSLLTNPMSEMLEPLNSTMTWLFNSHFYNVRKALNDTFVVDPSKIELTDFLKPGPGRIIRLKPTAMGTDTRTAVTQLPVADITAGHIKYANEIGLMMQRVSGVMDNVMGMLSPGGRKTATEVRTSSSSSLNRLKLLTEYMSALGWDDLGGQLVMNTQQLFQAERAFRVVGSQGKDLERYLRITPEMIAGQYSFIPVDGTMPIDRFAQANLYVNMMKELGANPQLQSQYDFGKLMGHALQLMGVKNLNQFKIEAMPQAGLSAAEQAGDLVRLGGKANGGGQGGGNSGTGGGGAGSAERDHGRVRGAGQIPGMGPAG